MHYLNQYWKTFKIKNISQNFIDKNISEDTELIFEVQ